MATRAAYRAGFPVARRCDKATASGPPIPAAKGADSTRHRLTWYTSPSRMSPRMRSTPASYCACVSEDRQASLAGPFQRRALGVSGVPWCQVTSSNRHASSRPSNVPTSTQNPPCARRWPSRAASMCSTHRRALTALKAACASTRPRYRATRRGPLADWFLRVESANVNPWSGRCPAVRT